MLQRQADLLPAAVAALQPARALAWGKGGSHLLAGDHTEPRTVWAGCSETEHDPASLTVQQRGEQVTLFKGIHTAEAGDWLDRHEFQCASSWSNRCELLEGHVRVKQTKQNQDDEGQTQSREL